MIIFFLPIKNKIHNLLIYFYLVNQNVIFCYMRKRNKSIVNHLFFLISIYNLHKTIYKTIYFF